MTQAQVGANTPASVRSDADNGSLYALGFAALLVAADVIRRRKNRIEFIENAALAAIVGATIELVRGKR